MLSWYVLPLSQQDTLTSATPPCWLAAWDVFFSHRTWGLQEDRSLLSSYVTLHPLAAAQPSTRHVLFLKMSPPQ